MESGVVVDFLAAARRGVGGPDIGDSLLKIDGGGPELLLEVAGLPLAVVGFLVAAGCRALGVTDSDPGGFLDVASGLLLSVEVVVFRRAFCC